MRKANTNDRDKWAYELEVARGSKSSRLSQRTAAEKLWKAIAQSDVPDGIVVSWCEHVAKIISDEIFTNPSLDERLRGSAALRSIGLAERDDENRQMRAIIGDYLDFQELVDPQLRPKELTPTVIVRRLRRHGYFKNISDRNAAKTVKRELLKLQDQSKSRISRGTRDI